MSDPLKPVSPQLVGQDAMYRLWRIKGPDPAADASTALTFRQTQVLRLTTLELDFVEHGWPPFSGRVQVSAENENAWSPMSPEWEKLLVAEGLDPRLETFAPAPIGIERGIHFTLRRIEPLSPEYWLIREALAIREVLDAATHDDTLGAAHLLGVLRQQAHQHRTHLQSLTVGQICLRGPKQVGQRARTRRSGTPMHGSKRWPV